MEKIVLIFSGGLDSTTLLYDLLMRGNMVKTLSIDYGQRHGKELESAQRIAHRRGVEWRRVDLSGGLRGLLRGSSQTDPMVAVPEGHYAEESMKKTIVPNRNMMMLSVAVAYAIASDFEVVAYAAHAGDHAIYPDCRPEFTLAMQQAIKLADWKEVGLVTPFIHKTKAQIVAMGNKLCVPFEWTWTCYRGAEIACGRCGTCVERLEAFELAGVHDPLVYADRESWREFVKA